MKAVILALAALATSAFAGGPQEEQNKAVVRAFYEGVFVDHDTRAAAERYLTPEYKQHNPYVATGRDAFIAYFEPYFATHASARSEIKRIVADGDLVVLHVHAKATPEDRGAAVVDIFRVEGGKIVEHWDAVQAIPATSANDNTMF